MLDELQHGEASLRELGSKLIKLILDEFGSSQSDTNQLQRQPGADAPDVLRSSGIRGITRAQDDLVEQCLSGYDLDG